MEKKSLHLWGIGNIGEGVISMIVSTYFIVFLTDTAVLPLRVVSLISLLGSICDFLMVPAAGAVLVSTKPMKWGRYRSWLLVCPIVVVLAYILCFTVVPGNSILTGICALTGYICGKIAWNIVYAANVSLTALLPAEGKEKNAYTSQKMMGSNIGRLLGNSLTPAIVAAAAVRFGEANGYRITVLVMGIVYIAASMVHFYICKDIDAETAAASQGAREGGLSAREILRIFAREPRLFLVLVIDLTSNVASLVLPTLAVYFYKYCLEREGMISLHMMLVGLGGLIGASIVRAFGGRFRNNRAILLLLYFLVGSGLLLIRAAPYHVAWFMVLSVCISIFTGMTSPFELSLYIEISRRHKEKYGEDATGFIMGLSNLPVKFASVIKSALVPAVLMAAGYVANMEPTAEFCRSIINAYTLIPTIFPVLGMLLLGFGYKNRKGESHL